MHHPPVDQRDTGKEHHPHRYRTPAQRCKPRMREVAACDQDEETAEHAENEAGRDRDVNRAPPGRVGEHGGALLESACGDRVEQQPNSNEETRERQHVTSGSRGIGIAQARVRLRSSRYFTYTVRFGGRVVNSVMPILSAIARAGSFLPSMHSMTRLICAV